MQNNTDSKQQIMIKGKESVLVDHVNCVRALDSESVILETSYGEIVIEGELLKIDDLSKSEGRALISGEIKGVFYLEKRVKKKGRMV